MSALDSDASYGAEGSEELKKDPQRFPFTWNFRGEFFDNRNSATFSSREQNVKKLFLLKISVMITP